MAQEFPDISEPNLRSYCSIALFKCGQENKVLFISELSSAFPQVLRYCTMDGDLEQKHKGRFSYF